MSELSKITTTPLVQAFTTNPSLNKAVNWMSRQVFASGQQALRGMFLE